MPGNLPVSVPERWSSGRAKQPPGRCRWDWSKMSDATEQEQKRPLTLGRSGGRLELRKSVEAGQVRQSFSHGRSKTVTVEVRKKRVIGPGTAEVGRAETTPMVGHEPLPTPRPPAAEP